MKFLKIIILLSLVSAQIILGCASSKGKKDNLKNITGKIEVVGNEPFTSLALKIDHSETYILKCDDENKNLLEQNQGKIAKIYYQSIDKSKQPSIIFVKKAVIINDDK